MSPLSKAALVAALTALFVVSAACAPPPPGEHPFHKHPWATCIRHHESDRGPWPHSNGYQAQNPRSTASGAYQFVNGTWAAVSADAGHPGYRRAADAPPWVQDDVAQFAYHHGWSRHWTACRGR